MINFGVPRLRHGDEKFRTNIDMTLRTGRNVSFVYPNEESPILRATLADDQAVGLQVIAPSMATVLNGELALRSGEIYYIQKNFYVTEGAVKFPSIGGYLANDTLTTLSLRARLREFDPEGNRIDIYLVLQDAPFDDLNPRFESIPLRSTNVILELLGQSSVSPGTVGDGGLQSVVSVASAATDVFSRLGLLQGRRFPSDSRTSSGIPSDSMYSRSGPTCCRICCSMRFPVSSPTHRSVRWPGTWTTPRCILANTSSTSSTCRECSTFGRTVCAEVPLSWRMTCASIPS